jgi:hypothetical protein
MPAVRPSEHSWGAFRKSAAKPWPIEDAMAEWGYERAVYAPGSNSRVRGRRARAWAGRLSTRLSWIGSRGSCREPQALASANA